MPGPSFEPVHWRGGLSALLAQAGVFDLVGAAVAILDAHGQVRYRNAAFARLDAAMRDAPERFGDEAYDSLLACPRPRAVIAAGLREGRPQSLAAAFYFGPHIPAELTLVVRPVLGEDGGGEPRGLFVHIAEESVEYAGRALVRRQHDLRLLAERAHKLNEDKLATDRLVRSLLEHSPFPMVLFSRSRQALYMNRAWQELLGTNARDGIGQSCGRFLDCYRAHGHCPLLGQDREIRLEEEGTVIAADGRRVSVLRSAAVFTHLDEPVIIEAFIDLTERKRAEAEMRKLSSAIAQTADIVLITDRNGVVEYVNEAFERITGYARSEILGQKPSLIRSGVQGEEFYRCLWETILAGEVFRDVFVNRRKNGDLYYEEKTITPLKDERGEITHFVATGKDITERVQAQERLYYLAHHDVLTDLPNRVLFMERLSQALTRAHWHQRVVAVIFLDLDRFKYINDTLGHDAGDSFLRIMAARLKACLREGDTVARLGGDEFAILLEDVAQAQDVSHVADKILKAFAVPFTLEGREFFLSVSMGISLYPNDAGDAATLLRNADTAMYRAKDLGRNSYQFYSAEMSAMALERLTLETSLRHALARDEFVLYYQPQVDLASGMVCGAEALLRWRHPEFGLLMPLQFISLAEDNGLILPIGEWVLRAAVAQVEAWRRAGRGLRLAVNVSGRQLHDPRFVSLVEELLAQTGLDPSALELEITESVIMKHTSATFDRLQALVAMGVRLAIDDFGTGYSSLSYLKRFRINTLKIDKSFVRDLAENHDDAEIVRAIITMGRGLGLRVVAEGVETPVQLALLRAHGCDAVQGYYFSRPLPAEAFERLVPDLAQPLRGAPPDS